MPRKCAVIWRACVARGATLAATILLYEGVGGGQDSGSVLEEPSAQSGAEVGHAGVIIGEWARREAVRAEDASKAVFELEPIAFASRIPR
jgi:hypothetical protein